MSTDIWVWISAVLSLCIFSFLWKDSRVYRWAQNIFLGIGAGHGLAVAFRSLRNSLFYPLFEEKKFSLVLPLILLLLLYTKFIPKLEYLSKISLAFPIGLGAGIVLRSTIGGQLFPQVAATLLPLNSINNIIIVLGTFCVTFYFLFTIKANRNTRVLGKVGIYLMMVTFGISFATSVAANTAIYLGFLQNIFGTWLGIIK